MVPTKKKNHKWIVHQCGLIMGPAHYLYENGLRLDNTTNHGIETQRGKKTMNS